ncbi:3-hydroxyacyl-CoA dehydrogenase NAD-binding domain-containing protein (plasmid) [Agrobacterium tumefaciens]|uniref:3-hydroxyacyl-CoA dehydrogenase NAD-binding domain-containing protein n=1 Tax=Agrobacterium tumefaciens TaxID=358 RepID=UPI001573FC23|nr:3-hydroxyacyl-CoA dehydrogenase NAD-binding domain-containing protein [Agrobacterium tumefaciens]NSZ87325.1 enoyl-CoA hydratase [Agrobacterium tumefaciens]WCA72776.1 3-hydroxyacyl-CoA dehydrogenase NAD-binding domain-containing protein [Agrobacterium tumefaciens]
MPVTYEFREKRAIITFDNPPLNIFGQAMRAGLKDAIARARGDRPERLILRGAGRAFVAGSDAREFDGPALSPHLNDILLELIALPFPTIAVITGPALGGGLEIALACRARVASPGASFGLPEVTLGIVPGAGGTQRLSRLIGVAEAADLIGQGRTIAASEAFRLGLVDLVDDDPMAAALAFPADLLADMNVADHRPAPASNAEAIEAAHTLAYRRATGQNAPHIAIDLVAASATDPLDATLERERAAFLQLRHSAQAAALRHVFFAERAAQSQGKAFPAPERPLSSAIVVGGGLMGAGITYALTLSGLRVHVVETDAAGQARAMVNLDKLIAQGTERRAIRDAEEFRSRLSFGAGFADLPPVDLAIEAAFENMDVKKSIFADLQTGLSADTVLATNTSYLDVDIIAKGIVNPGRFLGLHFFAPAHVMKLLEIVRSRTTDAATLGKAFALSKQLNKMPVLAGVCDGFIGNRILSRYRHAADVMLIEGATPKAVDEAMRDFGMAMGPYEAQDMSGLDIAHANRKRQNPRERTDIRYVPIADHLVEVLGRLGRKTGAGWYDYDTAGKPVESPVVTEAILQASKKAGIRRETMDKAGLAERAILAMVLEATAILEEGIAQRPQDIDLVLIHGYGFPRFAGGLMHFADQMSLPVILTKVEALAAADPRSWNIPSLLRQLVSDGHNFESINRDGAFA